MFSLGTKIAAAVALAAILASGVLGWQLRESLKREGAAEAALSTAVAANDSLVKERARAVAEAERNKAISAAALKDTEALGAQVAAIKERLRNGEACRIDPADADALDRLFQAP